VADWGNGESALPQF